MLSSEDQLTICFAHVSCRSVAESRPRRQIHCRADAAQFRRTRSQSPPTPPDLVRCRRKQGPVQFLENNPTQSSFRVRFMCPKTRRNWLRRPIVRFHPGSSCPSSRPEAKPHPWRLPPFPRDSCVSWHPVNLRNAASSGIIRTSEHFHVFSRIAKSLALVSAVWFSFSSARRMVATLSADAAAVQRIRDRAALCRRLDSYLED